MAGTLNKLLMREKPEVVVRAKGETAEILMELNLAELRAILNKTQGEIALALGVAQPTIARMEKHGNDLRVSSLKRYIEAAGGKLRLDVELPDGTQFGFDNRTTHKEAKKIMSSGMSVEMLEEKRKEELQEMVLEEAAKLVALHGESRQSAWDKAEDKINERQEATASGKFFETEGPYHEFHDSRLNAKPVSPGSVHKVEAIKKELRNQFF